MSYNAAKNEALFLSDKMAYELNLTDAQYEAVYEINLDYLMSVNGHGDAYGTWWNRRNTDLKYVLTAWQYEKFMDMSYFYRPLTWKNGSWTFNVYSHYSNKNHFYKARPKAYTSYKGGNNKKSDGYYADKKVNKPASTPTAKNGHSNKGKNMAGNSNNNNKKGNITTAKPNDKTVILPRILQKAVVPATWVVAAKVVPLALLYASQEDYKGIAEIRFPFLS